MGFFQFIGQPRRPGCYPTTRGNHLILLTFVLLALASASFAQNSPPRPADPFADPKDDVYNPLRYIASNVLTAIAFSLVLVVAIAQSFMTWRVGGQFMLAMVIAAYTFAVGLALRFGLHAQPESKGIYIAEYLFVVLSPCGFIAANYVLLGRMSRWINCDKHLLIPATKITKVFVISDVVTFLVQAVGGSTSTSNDIKTAEAGAHIFLAGLALQLASFFLFTCLYIRFIHRVRTLEPQAWSMDSNKVWYQDWRSLAGALGISCIGILIRSVYRTIELGQGYHGHLATTEAFFYGLDTLPLFIAIAVYVPFWPGRFIVKTDEIKTIEEGSGAEKSKRSSDESNN